MKHQASFPQKSYIEDYPEPDESSPQPHTLSL